MGRVSRIPEIEQKVGKPILQFLKESVERGLRPPEIAELAGVSPSTIYDFIKKYKLTDKMKAIAREKALPGAQGELKTTIDEYLRAKEIGDRSPKTIEGYRDALYGYVKWLEKVGKAPTLISFNTEYLRDYFYYLKTEARRYGKPFTASTRHAYYRVLRAFGYWLEREEIVEKTPMKRVEIPKIEKREPEDIPFEIIAKIQSSFGDSFVDLRNMTILSLFLDTGMRLNDVCLLESDQINIETGRGKIIGKGNKERVIQLTETMLDILRDYLEIRAPKAKTGKLWINSDGSHFKRESLRKMISGLSEKAPGYRIHPHLFRHVWAKSIAESGANLLAIAKMGGWEDIKLVERYASAFSVEKAFSEYLTASPLHRLLSKGEASKND